MTEFFQIALSLPTVVFSALLVVLSLYWGLVVLGALDLDFADVDLDFDVDTDLGIEMGVDIGSDVDVDAGAEAPSASLLMSAASALGLGVVPVTVVVSIITLFAWLFSFTSVYYLTPLLGDGALAALLLGVGSAALSLIPTVLAVKPLKHLFHTTEGPQGGRALVGTVCVVSTSRVDARFGQATVEDDGAGLILPIRCEDVSNGLTRGSKAVIIDFDSSDNSYMVEPYDVFLGTDRSNKGLELAQNISRAFDESDARAEAEVAEVAAQKIPETMPQKGV